MSESKFGALRDLKKGPQPVQLVEPERRQGAGEGESSKPKQGPGRPAGGKRSNPDYERLTILVRKSTRRAVDLKMVQEPGSAADLSELVDNLLAGWAG